MSSEETFGSELIIQRTGQVFPLAEQIVTVGSGEDNVIILTGPQVSVHHVQIYWQTETNTYIIEDLGSAEGTYVNERRIEAPQQLRHGDVLRVGHTIIDVKLATATGMDEVLVAPLPPLEEDRSRGIAPVLVGVLIAILACITILCVVAGGGLLLGRGQDTPDVIIQSPSADARLAVGDEFIIKAVANGAKDITLLELSVDDALVATTASSDPNGQALLTVNKPWVFGTPGEHKISAIAHTASERSSRPASIEVNVVDTSAPLPTPTPIAEPDQPTKVPMPTEMPTLTPTPKPGAPQIEYFHANPQSINAGDCTMLEWGQVSGADMAWIEPDVGGVGTPGTTVVCPQKTTTYVLNAEGLGGTTTTSTTVSVAEALTDLTIDSINFVPSPPIEGQDTEVQITIRNIGAGKAGPFDWDWRPGSEPTLSGRIEPGLNPDDQIVVTAIWQPASAYASLTTVARVDTRNEVSETDKGNNQLAAIIEVRSDSGGAEITSPTSDPNLDGYRGNNGTGSNKQDVLVGNGEMVNQGELVWRGFMSFDISDIPAGSNVKNVELRFFQAKVGGNPYGKLGNLIIDHVVYGSKLSDNAYHVPALESAVLPQQTAPASWYILSDPTLNAWVQNDLAAGRATFQVRLRFMQETDGDGQEDYLGIESGNNFFGTGNVPQLIVTYGP